jgi:hypothetical protein
MSCLLPDMPINAQILQKRLMRAIHGLGAIFRHLGDNFSIRGICQCEGVEKGHSTLDGRQVSYLNDSGHYVFVGGLFSHLAKFTRRRLTTVRNLIFLVEIEDLSNQSYDCYLYVNILSLLPYKVAIYFPDNRFFFFWITWQDDIITYREIARGLCPFIQEEEDPSQRFNQEEAEG